jgi:hypothetical protein
LLLQAGYVYSVFISFFTDTQLWLVPYVYASVLCCVVVICFKATITSPSDPKLATAPQQLVYPESFYCETCKATLSLLSKHCPYCSRCVWLHYSHSRLINNCVGWNNYKSYRIFLGLLALNQAFLCSFSCQLLIQSFTQQDQTRLTCLAVYNDDLVYGLRFVHALVVLSASVIGCLSAVAFVVICKDSFERSRSSKAFVELSDASLRPTMRNEPKPEELHMQTESSPTFLDVSGDSEITFR